MPAGTNPEVLETISARVALPKKHRSVTVTVRVHAHRDATIFARIERPRPRVTSSRGWVGARIRAQHEHLLCTRHVELTPIEVGPALLNHVPRCGVEVLGVLEIHWVVPHGREVVLGCGNCGNIWRYCRGCRSRSTGQSRTDQTATGEHRGDVRQRRCSNSQNYTEDSEESPPPAGSTCQG